MLEVVVGTFHEPAIHRIGYAVCHRIFESYFDVEFIILLKEAVGNDVEELLFVIVPILSRQCGCNIFKLCFQYPVSLSAPMRPFASPMRTGTLKITADM